MTARETAARGWTGTLDAIREHGFNPRSLAFYIMMGRDSSSMDSLADTFLPGGFLGGSSAPGTPVFFAAPEAAIAVAPLGIGGARDVFIPPSKWIRSRPDDPVNGVVWCFTAREVMAGGPDLERDLSALWQASLTLKRKAGVGFPLYVVVTGNELPGFAGFISFLPEKAFDAVVGWVRKDGVEDDWRGLGADVTEMERWLAEWRDVRLYPGREDSALAATDIDEAYLLPQKAAGALRGLVDSIGRSAPPVGETAGIDLRGAFLAGLWKRNATREGEVGQDGDADENGITPGSTLETKVTYPPREAFARSLFRNKILPERWLISSSAEQIRKTGSWTRRLAILTVLCILTALLVRGVIGAGLERTAEGPAKILSETEEVRRWLRSGASGEAPLIGGYRPPRPVAIGGGAPPVLPELPEIYQENMKEYLPGLSEPGWFWKQLFRIGKNEQVVGQDAVDALGGQMYFHLSEEQVAIPIRDCMDRVGGDSSPSPQGTITPQEFNCLHPTDPLPVNWRVLEISDSAGKRVSDEPLFTDSGLWRTSGRELLQWVKVKLGALSSEGEFRDLPDRFSRRRLLDAANRSRELAERLYVPWTGDGDLEEFLSRNEAVDSDGLWAAVRAWKHDHAGGWKNDELRETAKWLECPPAFTTPEQWISGWRQTSCIWEDNPESPLFTVTSTLWKRELFQWLVGQYDALPRTGQMIRDAAEQLLFAPAPLPRIPLSALASASYDPVGRFRPEIWKMPVFSRAVEALKCDPDDLSVLADSGLLEEEHARIIRQTRVEPVRHAILSHARSYADYWMHDIAVLANPANWLLRDPQDGDMPWTHDGEEEAELYFAQTWSDFHASLAMIDARDLTRRLLMELSKRRVEALTALVRVLNGLDDSAGLAARVEYALVALAEDAKMYETPEYWNAAAVTLRAWRSLGRNPQAALERMGKTLARQDGQVIWESFFPVLGANFFMPDTGEPVKLGYWRGFVLAALNLIQAETQRERWRNQRRLLLRVNSFPWLCDASGTPAVSGVSEMRKLLKDVGFTDIAGSGQDDLLPELPGDAEIQAAIRGLFAGLGWGNEWLPPCNRELDASVNRLVSALGRLEDWDALGGVPIVLLPQREQSDPRYRYLRALVMRQGKSPSARFASTGGNPSWELPYESSKSRWAWSVKDQIQLRVGLKGSVVFDFYNQTVPAPQARIGQARIASDSWPMLSLLLAEGSKARPYPGASVEADEPITVWRARLPVQGFSKKDVIWWDFAFALPAVFGPETAGGATLLDEWPNSAQWQVAVEEWNRFVGDDVELRIPLARDAWTLEAESGSEWSYNPSSEREEEIIYNYPGNVQECDTLYIHNN